jgi:hypothetical protein
VEMTLPEVQMEWQKGEKQVKLRDIRQGKLKRKKICQLKNLDYFCSPKKY